MAIFQRDKTVVGLDIGSHSVKLVHLTHENDTYGLLAGLAEEYPASPQEGEGREAITATIGELFRQAGLKPGGVDVVTAVSGAGTAIKQVEFPLLTDDDVASSLRWQAGKKLPFGPDEAVVDYQVMVRDNEAEKMLVLLTAVTRVHLAEHLDLLKQVGIDPPIIDLGPLALANTLLAAVEPVEDHPLVLLDLGASRTILNVFSPGGLFFTRDIDISGKKFTEEIQNHLHIDYDEAEKIKKDGSDKKLLEILKNPLDRLIFEIRRALTYYENRRGMVGFERMYLAGGGARLAGLAEHLHNTLGMTIVELDALRTLNIPEGTNFDTELVPRLGLAVGLAMRKIRKKHV
jgi:type IV pilus assembly protein PilM